MRLITTSYTEQKTRLPKIGRYILAQFDEEGVIVYQAYRPEIGQCAPKQKFAGSLLGSIRSNLAHCGFDFLLQFGVDLGNIHDRD
jgi:hypothetical protein